MIAPLISNRLFSSTNEWKAEIPIKSVPPKYAQGVGTKNMTKKHPNPNRN